MSDIREDLQERLETLYPGIPVYYRPPSNFSLEYPCIVYSLSGHDVSHANNKAYNVGSIFDVSLITVRPGLTPTNIPMLSIEGTKAVTIYEQSNLIHNKFIITIL